MFGVLIFGIITAYFFFNEYVSLGNKYIAASSMSLFNNRQEYSYSEIQIWRRPSRKQDGSWVYSYVFSNGKELSHIGAFDGTTIKQIQNAQIISGATPNIHTGGSVKQPNMRIKFISYLIWASMFLFIPWILKRLFNRKE